jgi:DNA-binding transcriptional LysR family regulator
MELHSPLADIHYCDDMPVALSLIRAGYGFSILPDLQSDQTPDIVCIPIRSLQPLSYGIYYKKGNLSNPVVKKFISILK